MRPLIILAVMFAPTAAWAQDTVLGDSSKLLAFQSTVRAAATDDPASSPLTAWMVGMSPQMQAAITFDTSMSSKAITLCQPVSGNNARKGQELTYETDFSRCAAAVGDKGRTGQSAPGAGQDARMAPNTRQ